MTKGTALLVLGAILLVAMALVGNNGTIARIAGMKHDQIEDAVDQIGMHATQSTGLSAPPVTDEDIVRPTVVGQDPPPAELEPEPEYERNSPVEDMAEPIAEDPDTGPREMDTTGFDPRIG